MTILFSKINLIYFSNVRFLSKAKFCALVSSRFPRKISSKIVYQLFPTRNYYYSSKPDLNGGTYASRYHPAPANEQGEETIKDMIRDINKLDAHGWDDLKTQIMVEINIFTEINVDSVLMNVMLAEDKIELAHSFMKYLKEIKKKANFLTYLKYMVLCSKHVEICGEEVILKAFNKVKSTLDAHPVLDGKRVECITQGLCATSEWRMSLEYLKKLNSSPTIETKNALACAALKNDDEKLAWEIMTKWFSHAEIIGQNVFKEYIIYLSKQKNSFKSDQFIIKIFQFLRENNIIINQAVAKEIEIYFASHRFLWKIDCTKVNRPAQCSGCKRDLERLDLTDQEFKYLKNAFFEKALKKSDVYINTTEKELNSYLNFVDQSGPFHIVIDGLNAAYSCNATRNNFQLAKQLLKVVKMLNKTSKRILVMGRNHMRFWPQTLLQYISERAVMFFTQNISQDDPFFVYAALSSGPHTLVLSSDLMRDHISRLEDPKLMQLFRRWQESHQIYLMVDEKNTIKFTGPLEHSIMLQGSMENGWHIPFDDEIILDPYENINNWLCIERLSNELPRL